MATRHEIRSRPKDAIAMLQADHHTVRQLFRAYRTAQDPATQWEIAQHIFDELDVHAQLEEVVFYQAVEEETTSLERYLSSSTIVHTDTPNGLFGSTRGAGGAVTIPGT
jgi:hypothetical protein